MDDHLTVARILKPQGIHGEIKAEALMDNPWDLAQLKTLYLKDRAFDVLAARVHDGSAFLRLRGIDTREAAEALRGALLTAPRNTLPPLPEGKHYIVDLIGCTVLTDTDEELGKIVDVLQSGGNDVYVIRGRRSCMIPAVKAAIAHIDIQNKRIVLFAERLMEVAVFEDTDPNAVPGDV